VKHWLLRLLGSRDRIDVPPETAVNKLNERLLGNKMNGSRRKFAGENSQVSKRSSLISLVFVWCYLNSLVENCFAWVLVDYCHL
jgi:hypothetical protein